MPDIENELNAKANMVTSALDDLLSLRDKDYDSVIEAMRYSAMCGGKRLRPAMLLMFYELFGGNAEDALPFACALEMIHTYSLIHDDLPCMDNDDMRRGKPSCHIAFGESTAMLAGDGLLTLAFETAAKCRITPKERVVNAIGLLAKYSGVEGMIGGQVIDLAAEGKALNREEVEKMYSLKTGALIELTARIAAELSGACDDRLCLAVNYCKKIGLAFQIVDDILDIKGDSAILGKPTGSDADENKSTFVRVVGLENAEKTVNDLTAEAKDIASSLGSKLLYDLADYLVKRSF